MTVNDDPYLWLEEVESESSLKFAEESNSACLTALGDPKSGKHSTYERILSVLQSDDRIPYVLSTVPLLLVLPIEPHRQNVSQLTELT